MGQRGRTSRSALALLSSSTDGKVETIERPDAAYDLTDEEADVWRAVVAGESADWFRPSQLPLLSQYCRHVVSSRKVAQMVRTVEAEVAKQAAEEGSSAAIVSAIKSIDRLMKMQERESRAIASLATKMRLSQQSTYDKSKKKQTLGKRPWE